VESPFDPGAAGLGFSHVCTGARFALRPEKRSYSDRRLERADVPSVTAQPKSKSSDLRTMPMVLVTLIVGRDADRVEQRRVARAGPPVLSQFAAATRSPSEYQLGPGRAAARYDDPERARELVSW